MDILFFLAMVTAPRCSAAFPTMGKRIRAIKDSGIPFFVLNPSMDPTRNSEEMQTNPVARVSKEREAPIVKEGISISFQEGKGRKEKERKEKEWNDLLFLAIQF